MKYFKATLDGRTLWRASQVDLRYAIVNLDTGYTIWAKDERQMTYRRGLIRRRDRVMVVPAVEVPSREFMA